MLAEILRNPLLWKNLSIPFVAAVVGWATNWVAIKLTFLPLRFVGLRPFLGWQGIIPSKARKMAETFVDSTMYRLGSFPELFEKMEPDRIAQHINEVIQPRLDDYTDDVLFEGNAELWESLPTVVKEMVYDGVRQELPRLVDNLMEDVGARVEELLDFKQMITKRLVEDKALLNRLFLESGAAEFEFIVNSGFHFGFLFGLVQLAVWLAHQGAWVLPAFGLVVGFATNWIAINLIFRPLHPRRLGPWTLHGLFLKRQKEVAAVWCRIVTREILTVRQIIDSMLTGPFADSTRALIRKHVKPIVEETVGSVKPLAEAAVGVTGFERIERSVGEKAIAVSLDPFDDPVFNEERAAVVESLLRERMESLPSEEFQDLLRPCFQEDEWKLIIMGAALGFLAGVAQLVFVFGGGV
jgi:uncharacterized membrane protein YheB (UPF0754 family)